MFHQGLKNPNSDLSKAGFKQYKEVFWNLSPAELVEHTLRLGQGVLSDIGALVIKTGQFTGRAPKDRFIVKDSTTENTVAWGGFNTPIDPEVFDRLHQKVVAYLEGKSIYARDAYACAVDRYRLSLRVISEFPWQNLFAYNMFLRPEKEDLLDFEPEWQVLAAPGFEADPAIDGTPRKNFAIIHFTRKMIIIGGSAYTGEIKKGIFSVLNFVLPHHHQVLSMHCSANVGKEGDTAIFFGLSGTGKTTLSADPNRGLIGDDEHGWSDTNIFNFEGGCYAKTIDLSKEKEPQIFDAIRFGSLLENVVLDQYSRGVDYKDASITENTRVSYPLNFIDNAVFPSVGGLPKNIFFLTADAFGVLPPISRLSPGQAMFHFVSGYTAKVAGTEEGITEPTTTFSACFGAPFLPLHPTVYAGMLGDKMRKHQVRVWLINTGWTGGSYGTGSRMKLAYTRAMITHALAGHLDDVPYDTLPFFGLQIPLQCPDVPDHILNPRNTWADVDAYDRTAQQLAEKFITNFDKFADKATPEMLEALPKSSVKL